MIFLAALPVLAPLPEPAAVVGRLRAVEREVARLPYAALREAMEKGWDTWTIDGTRLRFALTPDPYEGFWFKVKDDAGVLKVFRKESLVEGVRDTLAGRPFHLSFKDDVLRVVLEEGAKPQAPLSIKRLTRNAFQNAQHVRLGNADFAVLKEGFPLPESVVMIRDYPAGFLRTTFFKDEDLPEPVWFLYEGGNLHAVGLESGSVVFRTKPATRY